MWWYLRNARVLRTWGVLGGLVLPPLGVAALGFGRDGVSTNWSFLFVGHLVGALYAEVALRRPAPSGTRTATLDRRELHQYLPARLRFAPVTVSGLLVAIAAVALATADLPRDAATWVSACAVGALAISAAVAIAQRWVVARPQPFIEPEMIAADDAIRSQSVHMLAGSGTAVILSLVGTAGSRVAVDSNAPLSWIAGFSALASVPLAVVACLYYGHRAWRVRRGVLLRSRVPSA